MCEETVPNIQRGELSMGSQFRGPEKFIPINVLLFSRITGLVGINIALPHAFFSSQSPRPVLIQCLRVVRWTRWLSGRADDSRRALGMPRAGTTRLVPRQISFRHTHLLSCNLHISRKYNHFCSLHSLLFTCKEPPEMRVGSSWIKEVVVMHEWVTSRPQIV
jgi:hypothetical protein